MAGVILHLALLLFDGLATESVAKSCLTSWTRVRTAVLPIQCGVFIIPRANRFNIKVVMKGHQVYLAYEGCGISVI